MARKRMQYSRGRQSDGKKALRLAKSNKKQVDGEYKHRDVLEVIYNPTTAGSVVTLNGISEGVTSSNRTGLSVKMRTAYVKGTAILNQTDTPHTMIRVTLVRDREPNGVLPVYLDVFEELGISSLTNNINWHRFQILSDKQINLSQNGDEVKSFSMYKSFSINTRYKDNLAGGDSILKNGLFLLMWSDQVNDHEPQLIISTRTKYVDN